MANCNLGLRVISNITKEYPSMFKIVVYKTPRVFVRSDVIKRNREQVNDEDYIPSVSSLRRTKTLVQDIVLCNDFQLFCTFTFDPQKADRFNFGSCWLKMSSWLHHQKQKAKERGKNFTYLIVPEQHKSGAWHFHALISHYTGSLRDSHHFSASGRPIYNITSFRSGFTTAVEIDNKEALASYVTKYITKDFIKQFNQRRFMCSKGLIRPKRELNSNVFATTPPLFRRKVAENLETEQFLIDSSCVF